MFFHVILTTECNSQCLYCYQEALEDTYDDFSEIEVDYSMPKEVSYDISVLDRFCRADHDCVLTFYGGEPLLYADKIEEIISRVKAKLFMIQTNGLLLDHLKSTCLTRFHTILVSIDGDEDLTDYYRGGGTFRKVVDNLRLIRQKGFKGELVARMTVMENTDIFKQVKWLLCNDEFSFSSVHWQLNAGFWSSDFKRRDFKRWSEQSYNPGIEKLAEFWVDRMEEDGDVLRLYPLLGITQSLLLAEKASFLRCGGGWINYAIQTDGHIIPCPAIWGMKTYYLGHIGVTNPLELDRVFVKEPCHSCKVVKLCGGRCLYANLMKRWNSEAYGQVCQTVKVLTQAVLRELPRIQKLIDTRKVRLRDFEYVRYNGCEIIP